MATTLKTPNFNAYRRTIPAQDQTQIDAEGDFFYVKEAEQPLLYQMDLGPDLPWDVGMGPDSRQSASFSRLTIKNPWSVPVVVVVIIGKGGVIDNRFTLVPSRDFALPVYEANTVITGRAVTTIDPGASIALPGTPILPIVKRKSLIVSNLELVNAVYILDNADNLCAAVFAKTSFELFCSGPVKVKNPTGAAVNVAISEIWYKRENA